MLREGISNWICSKWDFGERPSEGKRIRLRPDREEVTTKVDREGFPTEGQEGLRAGRWTRARQACHPPTVWWAAGPRNVRGWRSWREQVMTLQAGSCWGAVGSTRVTGAQVFEL